MTAPIAARTQIRRAAIAALEAAVAARNFTATIQSPGDWNNPPETLPAIQLRAPDAKGESVAKAAPAFELSVTLELQAFAAAADTEADAQDAVEQLDAWIEQTLFTDYALLRLLEQVASIETTTTISGEGAQHFGILEKRIVLETIETFTPAIEVPLSEWTLTIVTEALATEATAATGSVLTFAAGALSTRIGSDWLVTDLTNPGAVPAATTVGAVTATTVTLSNPVAGSGVAAGDRIIFAPPHPALDVTLS